MRIRLLLVALASVPTWAPTAAYAHPFGEPQSVEVAATPTGVRVVWQATPDDVIALAAHLGVVGGSHIVVFEDGEYDADQSSESAGIRLAEEAPVLADYLDEHIRINTADGPCTGELAPVADVMATGATVDFDCGGPVDEATIAVTTLTDLDPAYRTLATGPEGQRHAYTSDADSFGWSIDGAADPVTPSAGRSAALQLGGMAAGCVLLALVVGVVRRRVLSSRGGAPFTFRWSFGQNGSRK
jgi:hypothetical protein